MKVNRIDLVKSMKFAKMGTSARGETVEQSNAFVFANDELITFNDEILTRSPSLMPDELMKDEMAFAVPADDILKVLEKLPDDEVSIKVEDGHMIIEGMRKEVGVDCFAEILLPYDAIPVPSGWSKLEEANVPMMLQQAARTCGKDATSALTTLVHATPEHIEACDNWRMFRAEMNTGFPEACLMPATSVMKLDGLDIKRVSIGEGWAHFRTSKKQIVSIRCSHEKYHEGMDALLDIGDDAIKTILPNNLGEILGRAAMMIGVEDEPYVRVHLSEGKLLIESRKSSGWYKERKRVKYTGKDITFDVHPKFLAEILQRTREVWIGSDGKRLAVEADGVQFVVALAQTK